MDTIIIEALACGGVALTSGVGWMLWRKSAPLPPAINLSDIPLIEIDGKLVPHPTIVARQQKQGKAT